MFNLWNSLQSVTHYEYESKPGSKSKMGWAGLGRGQVTVHNDESSRTLYFQERGEFTRSENSCKTATRNEFIWQQISDTRIKLLHSRQGRDNQVELFDLLYDDATDQWLSETAHACGEDLYSGKAVSSGGKIHFFWSISGPRKQENLHYRYAR